MNQLLWGALAMGTWIAGLFFLRFWSLSKDRLFVFLCLAFWFLAGHWVGLAIVNAESDSRHLLYLLRLFAFVLIIVGIVDKNRRGRARPL